MENNASRPEKPESRVFAASGLYLLAAMGLFAVSFLSGPFVGMLSRVFPGITREWAALATNVLYYMPFLYLPVVLWATRGRSQCLRLNPVSFGATVRIVVIALLFFAGVYNINLLWSAAWQRVGLNVFVSDYVRPANSGELTRSVLSATLLAGVCEELLFRGVMLSAWESRGGRRAVWVTALLFAMLHGSLLGLPAQLLCGLLLALIVRWTDSIYGGMIFHSAYNAAAVLFNYVTSGMESGGTGEVDLFSAIGGVGSVASMLLGALFIGLMIWGLLQRFRVQFALKNGLARMLNGQLPVNPTENPAERVAEMRRALSDAMRSTETPATDRAPLSAGTILVLAAGVLSALVLYALDIYGMLI